MRDAAVLMLNSCIDERGTVASIAHESDNSTGDIISLMSLPSLIIIMLRKHSL